MKLVIAGGSGFLGGALASALVARGDEVVVLSRSKGGGPAGTRTAVWTADGSTGAWAREIDGADAVINLAGEPLPAKRWTAKQKQRLIDSRVLPTRSVVEAIRTATHPPRTLMNASGIGIYPDSDQTVDESSRVGDGFLADVCLRWEAEAMKAEASGVRVVRLRSGVVLHRDGGALAQLVPPFRFGVGGPLGSGSQWWAWIHRDDWVRMVLWALETPAVAGALNVAAPEPSQQKEIARAIGRALHRPALLPAPRPALRLLLGEMADAMLLASQRAVPRVALDNGFEWRYPTLAAAINAEVD